MEACDEYGMTNGFCGCANILSLTAVTSITYSSSSEMSYVEKQAASIYNAYTNKSNKIPTTGVLLLVSLGIGRRGRDDKN